MMTVLPTPRVREEVPQRAHVEHRYSSTGSPALLDVGGGVEISARAVHGHGETEERGHRGPHGVGCPWPERRFLESGVAQRCAQRGAWPGHAGDQAPIGLGQVLEIERFHVDDHWMTPESMSGPVAGGPKGCPLRWPGPSRSRWRGYGRRSKGGSLFLPSNRCGR